MIEPFQNHYDRTSGCAWLAYDRPTDSYGDPGFSRIEALLLFIAFGGPFLFGIGWIGYSIWQVFQ